MLRSITGALFGALLVASPARAELFDASIGEDSVRIAVSGPLSRLLAVDKGEYEFGGQFGDIDDYDSEDYFTLHAGATLRGDAGGNANTSLTGGLGARVQFVSADSEDGGALALGGNATLKLLRANRLRFNAALWYGPDPASFGDIDEYLEYSVSVGYEVLRDAELYVGYRAVEVGLDGGPDVDLEDGAHIGVRLQF
nr:YfaZ family outer membrane protein [Panacagrimonas sp.]